MPCPVCIGYGIAYSAMYIQDDPEELDKLWEEIDGMLADDKQTTTLKAKTRQRYVPVFSHSR